MKERERERERRHIYACYSKKGMWPFKKEKIETETSKTWRKDMLLRGTDLEARVQALEMVDKEYKKRYWRSITADSAESTDLKSNVLIPD